MKNVCPKNAEIFDKYIFARKINELLNTDWVCLVFTSWKLTIWNFWLGYVDSIWEMIYVRDQGGNLV